MRTDVFISHSSLDKDTAFAACSALEAAGIGCWIAPRNIVPGREWGAAIVEAIDRSKVMVLIFSAHANGSKQIHREVERAISKGIPVVPMRIEHVEPSDSLAFFLNAVHWLDAFTSPPERHLRGLVEAIAVLLKIDLPEAAPDISGVKSTTPEGVRSTEPALAVPAVGREGASEQPAAQASVQTGDSALRSGSAVSSAEGETREGEKDDKPSIPKRAIVLAAAGLMALGALGIGLAVHLQSPGPPTETEWVSLPLGTRIVNRTPEPVATFTQPDRSSPRSINIRPMQTIPPSGTDQLLARKTVNREDWIRFPIGDGQKHGYVPAASVTILSRS